MFVIAGEMYKGVSDPLPDSQSNTTAASCFLKYRHILDYPIFSLSLSGSEEPVIYFVCHRVVLKSLFIKKNVA